MRVAIGECPTCGKLVLDIEGETPMRSNLEDDPSAKQILLMPAGPMEFKAMPCGHPVKPVRHHGYTEFVAP